MMRRRRDNYERRKEGEASDIATLKLSERVFEQPHANYSSDHWRWVFEQARAQYAQELNNDEVQKDMNRIVRVEGWT